MNVERARVVAVIIDVRNAILSERANGASRAAAAQRGYELVERAALAQGLRIEEWTEALVAEAELVRLFEEALLELDVEAPDPGPYAEISRESARGAPEPEPEAFARDARLLGRM
jgi:hypothetical protein